MALQAFPGPAQYRTERPEKPAVASGWLPSSEEPESVLVSAQESLDEHNLLQQLSQLEGARAGLGPQYFRTVQTGALRVERPGQGSGL